MSKIEYEKLRLDKYLVAQGLVSSRSQAESYIQMGKVYINGKMAVKSGQMVSDDDKIEVKMPVQYVGRAALKLESADKAFRLDWRGKTVLDVGSSTGGFTQYALLRGAKKVIAVDVGTNQLHPSLRGDERIDLHEKTDIRDVWLRQAQPRDVRHDSREKAVFLEQTVDIVVGDVSFISLREILPHVSRLMSHDCLLIAMVKPQFEARHSNIKHKGVIKNDRMRREVLKDFESWVQKEFKIIDKKDSEVAGSKGNIERFYCLKKVQGQ